MNANERFAYEKKIIASILQTENNFANVVSFGLTDDIFLSQLCKDAYNSALKYVFEFNKFPNHVDLFTFLMPSKNKELKNFILHLGQSSYELQIMPFVKHLLEQNISNDLAIVAKDIQSSNLLGLDLAYDVSNRVTKIIYKYFQKYTMDKTMDQSIDDFLVNIHESIAGKTHQYIPSGIKTLDSIIIGFHKKSVCVIGARPGIGKTAFMQQLNRNLIAQGIKTGIISIEMDTESLLVRDISAMTKINSILIESGKLGISELAEVEKATKQLRKQIYQIDEDSHQTPKKIMATINKWKVQYNIQAILIDYLQLIKADDAHDKFNQRNDLIIAQISEEFRKFAKSTGTPIILLSQLNRNNETRQDKRPQLSDLRESGAIEQDARQVLLLHCPDYYKIDPYDGKTPHLLCNSDNSELKKEEYFEVLIAKNRGGLTGITKLRYIKPIHTFENVHRKPEEWVKCQPMPDHHEPTDDQEEIEFPI